MNILYNVVPFSYSNEKIRLHFRSQRNSTIYNPTPIPSSQRNSPALITHLATQLWPRVRYSYDIGLTETNLHSDVL